MSTDQLSSTSYLVLGLLAREGPSTPYDLKRHVAATLGHFWSFPHALLYAEPARLASIGLATETQEERGRRRRVFTITDAGSHALRAWLERPNREPTELRDPGLLQIFFSDMGPSQTQGTIAREQLTIHRAKLAAYMKDEILGSGTGSAFGQRTLEQWLSHGLRMAVMYERSAVAFWEDVTVDAVAEEASAASSVPEDYGKLIA